MKALIIVDVQNDFLPGGALGVTGGDEIIPLINRLQQNFSCVLATKDWHPANHVSFASTHHKEPGESIQVKGLAQHLWKDHCIQGTPGAEFAPQLQTERIEKIFLKGTDSEVDSYSTFYDNAHVRSTGLADYLKKRGIDEIYIVGLTTEYCVKYSVFDAQHLGLKTHVILDACRGIEIQPGDIQQAIEEMKAAGADITDSRVGLLA